MKFPLVSNDALVEPATLNSIPLVLNENIPGIIEIRGEVFIPISEFEKLNKEREIQNLTKYSNPRNCASGSLRQLDPNITKSRNLDTYIYNIGYFDKLMGAKISIVAWGAIACRQTGRFYESLANKSMLLCMTVDPWITNYSFTDGKDIVLFDNTTELVEKAEYYISHPNEAEKIASGGYEHMLKYHTTKARASQFLSLIKEYLT